MSVASTALVVRLVRHKAHAHLLTTNVSALYILKVLWLQCSTNALLANPPLDEPHLELSSSSFKTTSCPSLVARPKVSTGLCDAFYWLVKSQSSLGTWLELVYFLHECWLRNCTCSLIRASSCLAFSASKVMHPTPSRVSRSIHPCHRTHTPLSMKGALMWTWKNNDNIRATHTRKIKTSSLTHSSLHSSTLQVINLAVIPP